MITVHHLEKSHLEKSRSHRVLWLLEELGAGYDVKRYQHDPETMLAPAALAEVHPLGKSPIITDGDLTVAESGAITEYLLEQYDGGSLQPGGEAARSFTYWLHYAEGSFMPLMLLSLVLKRIEGPSVPLLVRPVSRVLRRHRQCRRHPDELLHRGRGGSGGARRQLPAACAVSTAHSTTRRLSKGAGCWRPVRFAVDLAELSGNPTAKHRYCRG